MELARLLAPNGLYHKVWLAAHWDKKLKKQDYAEINLARVISSLLENDQIVSLRAAGHLLFGMCKVFQKKFSVFEENAQELNTRLMMAFTTEIARQADPRAGRAFLHKIDVNELFRPVGIEERQALQAELDHLQTGQRTLARLEDITLRSSIMQHDDAARFGSFDLLGELSFNEEQDMAALQRLLPQPDGVSLEGLFDSAEPLGPLSGIDQARPASPPASPGDDDGDAALDIVAGDDDRLVLSGGGEDNDLARDDAIMRFDTKEEETQIAEADASDTLVAAPAEPQVKRRRKAWMYDDVTQITKEEYQQFVYDRSSISKPDQLDFDIVLPHVAPSMPDFVTTLTDLCPALADLINNGCKESERRLRTLRKSEQDGHFPEVESPIEEDPSDGDDAEEARMAPEFARSPLSEAPLATGLRTPDQEIAAPASPALSETVASLADSRVPVTEESLLRHPPVDMSGVLVPRQIDEDASFDARRWTGYSQRSEKMHSFLAKEFRDTSSRELSFHDMCKSSAQGRRDTVAGCFFELLVLKTNGVIDLQQDDPNAEIKITKARGWSSSMAA